MEIAQAQNNKCLYPVSSRVDFVYLVNIISQLFSYICCGFIRVSIWRYRFCLCNNVHCNVCLSFRILFSGNFIRYYTS